jgi:hypothetical protein
MPTDEYLDAGGDPMARWQGKDPVEVVAILERRLNRCNRIRLGHEKCLADIELFLRFEDVAHTIVPEDEADPSVMDLDDLEQAYKDAVAYGGALGDQIAEAWQKAQDRLKPFKVCRANGFGGTVVMGNHASREDAEAELEILPHESAWIEEREDWGPNG